MDLCCIILWVALFLLLLRYPCFSSKIRYWECMASHISSEYLSRDSPVSSKCSTESLVLRSNNRNLILKSRESLVPRSCRWQVMKSASVKFAAKNLLWAQWGDTWKTCTIHPIFSSATYAEESFRQMPDLKSTTPKNMWQMKFHFMNALIVNTKQWIDIISINTSRGNIWGTIQQVLCATNALCESQMNTFWRNTCSSTLNPSVLFVTRNSTQKRIWKGTWKHTKCKGVKIVENLLAVRNSSARTNKSTISKKIMTKRLI